MAAHVWAGGPPPPEYIVLTLCRDVYHCTPSALDDEDATRILEHMIMMQIERQADEAGTRN